MTLQDVNGTAFKNNNSPSGFLNNLNPKNDSLLEYTIQNSFTNNPKSGCDCYEQDHNKLSVLFCCSLNIVHNESKKVCSTSAENETTKTTCNFETVDGIVWHTEDITATSTDLTNPVFNIIVDVDNKWGGRNLKITSSGYKKTRFSFYVYYDGKIKVDNDAKNILADAMSNKRINY